MNTRVTLNRNGHLRVTLHTVGLAKLGLVDTVHLGEFDVVLFQSCSCLFVVRSQGFAVTTPAFML